MQLVKNNLTVEGFLMYELELRYTPMGTALATTKLKQDNGDEVILRMFGPKAESLVNQIIFRVGARVRCMGSMKTQEWTTREGQDMSFNYLNLKSLEVVK